MIPSKIKEFIDKSIHIFKQDSRILGLAAGGSYLYGGMDEYSDIDLVIAVSDDSFADIMEHRANIAEKLGDLLTSFNGNHVGEPRLLICIYGPDLIHVDLKFVAIKDIAKRVEDPAILWERDNCISEGIKVCEAKFPKPTIQWMEDRFWGWIHYGATKIARGEIFEAIGSSTFLNDTVIGPLIQMKNGKLPRSVRRIEMDAPEYVDKLIKTIPSYDKNSCMSSLEATIVLYEELRDHFIDESFIYRSEAEKLVKEFVANVKDES